MKNKFGFLLLVSLAFFVGCKKNDSGNGPDNTQKIAPEGFSYRTSKDVTLSVTLLDNQNAPLKGVPVSIYTSENGFKGELLFKGGTNNAGLLSGLLSIPAYMDTLYVDAAYIGIMRDAKVFIANNAVTCTLGGSDGFKGNIVPNSVAEPLGDLLAKNEFGSTFGTSYKPEYGTLDLINGNPTNTIFTPMGNANILGVPTYLESPNDVIKSEMLEYLNYSLPESKSVPVRNPGYINTSVTSNLNIVKRSDVWITFVSEGAGYKNSLGYYKFPTNKPPQKVADIDTIFHIFPNCSLPGSGGNLASGSKVKLGRFEAGTSIGLVVFANGWISTNRVNTGVAAFFTDYKLNPERSDDMKKHTVMLKYKDLFIVGFDDQNRETGGSDQDFNDVLYYATSNPVDAIDQTGVLEIDVPKDTDGDGVLDLNDAFPNDPARAYINYYPSETSWGTLAFEDLWPNDGDYDLNDLVVRYQYKMISNSQNNVVEMYGNFAPIAAGASYRDGFGVQFNFAPSAVKTVTGQRLNNGYITLNANGTEAGQSKAVIIPFDNYISLISNPGGASFVNTSPSLPKVNGDTAKIYIEFNSPISTSTLGTAPYNPFLISNMRRDFEVHLPNKAPTDKANMALLGTGLDASKPTQGIYYVTKENYPWALSFVEPFRYPKETINIKDCYLRFIDWAGSGGTNFTDWYKNTGSGYRNSANIY